MPKFYSLVTWKTSQAIADAAGGMQKAFQNYIATMNAEGWHTYTPVNDCWEKTSRDRDQAMGVYTVILEKIVD